MSNSKIDSAKKKNAGKRGTGHFSRLAKSSIFVKSSEHGRCDYEENGE
jgi:hypothetical protein